MKTRTTITTIWLGSFLLAIVIAEAYFLRTTSDGIPFLLAEDRPPIYKMLVAIYGINLGALLVAWFTKPFPRLQKTNKQRVLHVLALTLTIAYNALLLYLIAQGHWSQTQTITKILRDVKLIAGLLVFLVAPVNTYYFGIKTQ